MRIHPVVRFHDVRIAGFPAIPESFGPWSGVDDADPPATRAWSWNRKQNALMPHIHAKKKIVIAYSSSVDTPVQTPRIRAEIGNSIFALEPIGDIAALVQNKIGEACLPQAGMRLPQLQQEPGEEKLTILAGGIQIAAVVVVISA